MGAASPPPFEPLPLSESIPSGGHTCGQPNPNYAAGPGGLQGPRTAPDLPVYGLSTRSGYSPEAGREF
jgi:hypothetical protein